MDWLQISIESSVEHADELEDLLLTLGAQAVSLSDATDTPILEPLPGETPLWQRSWITGMFPAGVDPELVVRGVQSALGLSALPHYRVEALQDRDWIRACLADLKPMRFGRRLWICPSGQEVTEADAIIVQLDPGLAFGTGTHPSTALCLQALDAENLQEKTVIDYGCGSGILAVASAMLGARSVLGVDIDPQAVTATQDNARRNHVEARVQAKLPEQVGAVDADCDLLVANILAKPLLALAPDFAAWVTPGGRLILAGLLVDDATDIRERYAPWFALDESRTEDGWLCLSGYRHRDS